MRRYASTTLVAILILSMAFSGFIVVPEKVSAYTAHVTINITNNAGFTSGNGIVGGSGTASDPYVIEGWSISGAHGGTNLWIQNTNAHFIIRNVSVSGATYGGIYLYHLSNGIVRDSIVTNCGHAGVYFHSVTDCSILNTTILHCGHEGFISDLSSRVSVSECNITSNDWHGIMIDRCNNCVLRNNLVKDNVIVSDTYYDKAHRGIDIFTSTSISVYGNIITGNAHGQAYDEPSSGNLWDIGYPSGGNYWSDYSGADIYRGPSQNVPGSDGIGDTARAVNTGVSDRYPLMIIPPFPPSDVPTAIFEVSPSVGTTSTVFSFNASNCSDIYHSANSLEVRWDWEDNGVWDTSWSNIKTIQHMYAVQGYYTMKMEVRDPIGNVNSTTRFVTVDMPIDTTSPTTYFQVIGTDGTFGWYLSDVSIWFDAYDTESGVKSIDYRIDSGTWHEFLGTFNITEDGLHKIGFHSHDMAGNVEHGQNLSFGIDHTAPKSTLTLTNPLNGNNGWFRSSVNITIAASDLISGCNRTVCRLNGRDWFNYSGSFNLTENGIYYLDFHAIDNAGNVELLNSVMIKVDDENPALTIFGTLDNSIITSKSLEIQWAADDSDSGLANFQLIVDGRQPIVSNSSTLELTNLTDGLHTITIRAIDNAGNSAEQTMTFEVHTSLLDIKGPAGPWMIIGLILFIMFDVLALTFYVRHRRKHREDMPPS